MASLSFEVEAGATFNAYSFQYLQDDGVTPVDLTGWTGKLQVRETTTSSTVAIEVIPTLTPSTGMVDFTFSATQTSSLTASQYVYALELYSPTNVTVRLVEGKIFVSPEVVR